MLDSVSFNFKMDPKKNNSAAKKESVLPMSRIKIIMKSSPDTENIGQDTLFLVARTTVSNFKQFFPLPYHFSKESFLLFIL